MMGQMHWLTVHSDNPSIRKGLELGQAAGSPLPDAPPDKYDGIVYYKRHRLHKNERITIVTLDSYTHLTRFIDEAVKYLWEHGIIE